jgi:REP element-mobilizing transposase RayT
MRIAEYVINAPLRERLFVDDADRRGFLSHAKRLLGAALLAYCLMDSHVHLVLAGAPADVLPLVERLRAAYARAFRSRHGFAASWRGPTRVHELDDARCELASKIRYVHLNPVRAGMVEVAIEWPWSSIREYVGLSFAGIANVARSRKLAGDLPGEIDEPQAQARPIDLASALAAAAQAYGFAPDELPSEARLRRAIPARTLFVHVSVEAGHTHQAIADYIGLTRERVTQLATAPVPAAALRAVRTLLADPRLRRRLEFRRCGSK